MGGAMTMEENKSQLAKDLSRALFICHLRDDLSELVEDARVQEVSIPDGDIRKKIYDSYVKATVLLACAMVDSKDIQSIVGKQ
jgi:hypothetical protein